MSFINLIAKMVKKPETIPIVTAVIILYLKWINVYALNIFPGNL